MSAETRVNLYPHFFGEKERVIVADGGLSASIWRYDGGSCALIVTLSIEYDTQRDN